MKNSRGGHRNKGIRENYDVLEVLRQVPRKNDAISATSRPKQQWWGENVQKSEKKQTRKVIHEETSGEKGAERKNGNEKSKKKGGTRTRSGTSGQKSRQAERPDTVRGSKTGESEKGKETTLSDVGWTRGTDRTGGDRKYFERGHRETDPKRGDVGGGDNKKRAGKCEVNQDPGRKTKWKDKLVRTQGANRGQTLKARKRLVVKSPLRRH